MMLWSLIKILFFVALIALLTLLAAQLMETEGGIQVTVAGTEYTFSALQSVIALVALVVAIWLVLKILSLLVAFVRFLNGDETALSRYFDRNRERRGYQALADGMMALASGEGRVAMNRAAKAERYLRRPELTQLLTAQAAELVGDHRKASETYKALIANEQTRFVGIRGILRQKLAEGERETALKLAQKALELKPKHQETQDVLLRLQSQAHDWAGARSTLTAKLKSGALPRDVYTRREAVLALAEARDVIDESASIEKRERAIEANRLSPDLVPAAALAARSYVEKGKPKYAVRILRKAWEAQPHPDLAAAFAAIAPDETPQERVKRFQTLTRIHPEHTETRLVRAELHIVAEDFPEARRALGDLANSREADVRALTLMAAVERGEGSEDKVVQGWLARALSAPRGPQWICENCQHVHGDWMPVCDNCDGLDTLVWKTPPTPEIAPVTGAAVLPMIVGSDLSATTADETVSDAEVIEDRADPEPGEATEPEAATAAPGDQASPPQAETARTS